MTEPKISPAARVLHRKIFNRPTYCLTDELAEIQSALTAYGNARLEEAALIVENNKWSKRRSVSDLIRALKERRGMVA